MSGDWYISPRWKAFGTLAGMAVEINGIEGNAGYFTLGTEYMITRNWGLGATWQYTKIGANANKSGFNGEFNWNANSALLYATAKF